MFVPKDREGILNFRNYVYDTEYRLLRVRGIVRLLAPLTDSILVEAAHHQPQFPCPKVSLKTG